MKKCPYCGSENKDENPVCMRCKAALPHEEKHETNEGEAETSEPFRINKKKLRS